MENVQPVAGGVEATVDAAVAAPSDALVAVAGRCGRQEYRLTVGETQMIVMPGLTEEGQVDTDALREAVLSIACDPGLRTGAQGSGSGAEAAQAPSCVISL